ncbi:MAG: hypothetical protein QM756_04410 [Polyangiaceae bacterium]
MVDESSDLVLVGRSSSHFTRLTRVFAAEFGVRYRFQIVPDLLSTEPADYADNPALKLPICGPKRQLGSVP